MKLKPRIPASKLALLFWVHRAKCPCCWYCWKNTKFLSFLCWFIVVGIKFNHDTIAMVTVKMLINDNFNYRIGRHSIVDGRVNDIYISIDRLRSSIWMTLPCFSRNTCISTTNHMRSMQFSYQLIYCPHRSWPSLTNPLMCSLVFGNCVIIAFHLLA